MSDQWSGAEDDINRLQDASASNTEVAAGSSSEQVTGSTAGFGSELGSADMSGVHQQEGAETGAAGKIDKAREAISGVSEKAGEIGSQATSKADAGMDKAASGLDSLASMVRERGESMGQGQVASLATAAADKMHSGAELMREKDMDQMMNDLETLIRRRPVESLLVAAGIGYLISRAR